jgi:hypothetical protein
MKGGVKMQALKIDHEFQNLLPALTADEAAALETSIEAEGCRDALIAWGDTLVDGHNRYEICNRRGFEYGVRQMEFESREDVIIWICANQNARRNITPEQRAYLLGRRYEAEKKKAGRPTKGDHCEHIIAPIKTAERIAAEIDVAPATVRRAADFARAVDTLAADSPTIKRKILSGEIKQPRAAIVEIAAKPEAERKEAIQRIEEGGPVEEYPPTRICRECGRELPIESFPTRYGKPGEHICRQCKTMSKRCSAGSVREIMPTVTEVVDALYGNGEQAEYTIDDILDEIKSGGSVLQRLILNAYEQNKSITDMPDNRRLLNNLISDIAGTIYELRRE